MLWAVMFQLVLQEVPPSCYVCTAGTRTVLVIGTNFCHTSGKGPATAVGTISKETTSIICEWLVVALVTKLPSCKTVHAIFVCSCVSISFTAKLKGKLDKSVSLCLRFHYVTQSHVTFLFSC